MNNVSAFIYILYFVVVLNIFELLVVKASGQ